MKLSAVVITYNEEKNIGRCIDSLRMIVDEIIVLDSFSTDKTEMICREKGALFHQQPWQGFSIAKNMANTLASGDFILSLDADEELSAELKKSLSDLKNGVQFDAYKVSRLTQYCGQWIRHGGWYPDEKIRVFKKGDCHWTGDVHEELVFKTVPKFSHLTGDLLHYSYDSVEAHLRKMFTYSPLAVQRDIEREKKYNLFIHGIVKPWFTFVRMYFLQLGFLDGFYGWIIASLSSFEKFLRYAKYRELKKKSQLVH